MGIQAVTPAPLRLKYGLSLLFSQRKQTTPFLDLLKICFKTLKKAAKVAHRPLRHTRSELIPFCAMNHEAPAGISIPPPPWRGCQSIAGSPYRSISPVYESSTISFHFIRFMRTKDHSVIRGRCCNAKWKSRLSSAALY